MPLSVVAVLVKAVLMPPLTRFRALMMAIEIRTTNRPTSTAVAPD